MAKLKALADESVKRTKHEIYAKGATDGGVAVGHTTTGEAAGSASNGDRKITLSIDNRYIRPDWFCDVCGVTMPDNQRSAHKIGEDHKHKRAMQLAEAERQSAQAQITRDMEGRRRAEAAARLIQIGFRNRRN